jgi:hypothetical protein
MARRASSPGAKTALHRCGGAAGAEAMFEAIERATRRRAVAAKSLKNSDRTAHALYEIFLASKGLSNYRQ